MVAAAFHFSVSQICSASEMTYIVSGGALNSTHSTQLCCFLFSLFTVHVVGVTDVVSKVY